MHHFAWLMISFTLHLVNFQRWFPFVNASRVIKIYTCQPHISPNQYEKICLDRYLINFIHLDLLRYLWKYRYLHQWFRFMLIMNNIFKSIIYKLTSCRAETWYIILLSKCCLDCQPLPELQQGNSPAKSPCCFERVHWVLIKVHFTHQVKIV